jgi:hypothetical protein
MTFETKTQREWLNREREKIKDRMAIAGSVPVLVAHYRSELSALSKRILALDYDATSR